MGMKKIFENKVIIIAVILAILGVGGYALYRVQSAKKSKDDTAKTQVTADKGGSEKTDNPPTEILGPGSTETTPTTNTNIGVLSDVSLTVYLQAESTTSQDGKTKIAAGSIIPYFYLPGGVYTVQKMVGVTWKDVATNINYPGHGGLLASFAGPTEDNISYRVLKIEGGTTKAISKTFVVKRAEISGGTKTYN